MRRPDRQPSAPRVIQTGDAAQFGIRSYRQYSRDSKCFVCSGCGTAGVARHIGEGQIMQKGRRVPAWLARRTYFKRIERWTRPGKGRAAAPPPAAHAAPAPSNPRGFNSIKKCGCRPLLRVDPFAA